MIRTALLLATLAAPALHAAELAGISFTHHDWELDCDNTRTCRASGYQADEDENAVSVLLTRRAGPYQGISIRLQLGDLGPSTPSTVRMYIGERNIASIKLDRNAEAELTRAQSDALLAAVLTDAPVRWSSAGNDWTLSNRGANAVLLKMDEFQGRVGTPGALARKGKRDENSVLPALPMPEITAVKFADTGDERELIPANRRADLLAELRKTIGSRNDNYCELFDENAGKLSVTRLSEQRLLVSLGCWMAAYNSGDGYWIINAQPPYAPVLVTNSGTELSGTEIYSIQKGRGIGDCISTDTWTWDGRRFVHTSSLSTGMCRQVAAGGAWELPTLVVQVKKAK